MSKDANKGVHYLPDTSRSVREEILEAAKTNQPGTQESSTPDGPIDLSAPLARIEGAWQFIGSCLERIRELESLVENYETKQVELTGQLENSTERVTELEQVFAAEKERSSRAEKFAAAVARRAKELEIERSDAHDKLKTLASALEGTFRNLPDMTRSVRAAA